MFEVKSHIPVPSAMARYPFAEMKVGDHFDAPRDMGLYGNKDCRQNSIGSCANFYTKSNNPTAKFTVRLIDENTVRCWRIA